MVLGYCLASVKSGSRVVDVRSTGTALNRSAAITYDRQRNLRSRKDCIAASSKHTDRERREECQGSHEHDSRSAQARRSAAMHGVCIDVTDGSG